MLNKNKNKIDIVIVSDINWNFMYQRHQQFTSMFAIEGYKCLFINRIGTLPLKYFFLKINIFNLFKLIFSKKESLNTNKSFPGIKFIHPPPFPRSIFFDFFKIIYLKFYLSSFDLTKSIVIHYSPQLKFFELFNKYKVRSQFFDCVHLFSKHKYWTDSVNEYRTFLSKVNCTFYDSITIGDEIRQFTDNYLHVPPGVSNDFFITKEPDNNKVLFFGHLRSDTDLAGIKMLGEHIKIDFVGISSLNCSLNQIFDKVFPPIPRYLLPEMISKYKYLLLPYKANEFQRGIIPAKLYECLATGRVVIYSGLILPADVKACLVSIEDFIRGNYPDETQLTRLGVSLAKSNLWESRYKLLKKEMGL
jgi:hypothetical protein